MPAEAVHLAITIFDPERNESILKRICTSSATELEAPEAVHQELRQNRGFPPPFTIHLF